MVDPVRNCQNDWYISFGKVDEDMRMITTTKHPSSVMSLGSVASNGLVAPLMWFPHGYQLTAVNYIKDMASNLIPWVKANFSGIPVIYQQDGVPAHTALRSQDFLKSKADIMAFWPKDMWPPYSPDVNPLDYAFWLHIKAKACRVRHSHLDDLKTSVNQHWEAMTLDFIKKCCRRFRQRLEAIIEAEGGYIEKEVIFSMYCCCNAWKIKRGHRLYHLNLV